MNPIKNTPYSVQLLRWIGTTEIAHAVVWMLIIGAVVSMIGVYLEFDHELTLLQQGGTKALQEYQMQMQAVQIDSIWQYITLGIRWCLPSAGGNFQAVGLALSLVGSIVAAATVRLARACAPFPSQELSSLVFA